MLPKLISLFLWLLLCSSAFANPATGYVSWIYDGDTIKVAGIGKVRLIGIDAPERKDSPRDNHYLYKEQIERKTLRLIAQQAFEFNLKQIKNLKVDLEFDQERTDSYGRTLAYVILPDGRILNQLLVEKGLAAVYRRFEFKQKQKFLQAEKSARDQRLGLWHK